MEDYYVVLGSNIIIKNKSSHVGFAGPPEGWVYIKYVYEGLTSSKTAKRPIEDHSHMPKDQTALSAACDCYLYEERDAIPWLCGFVPMLHLLGNINFP